MSGWKFNAQVVQGQGGNVFASEFKEDNSFWDNCVITSYSAVSYSSSVSTLVVWNKLFPFLVSDSRQEFRLVLTVVRRRPGFLLLVARGSREREFTSIDEVSLCPPTAAISEDLQVWKSGIGCNKQNNKSWFKHSAPFCLRYSATDDDSVVPSDWWAASVSEDDLCTTWPASSFCLLDRDWMFVWRLFGCCSDADFSIAEYQQWKT